MFELLTLPYVCLRALVLFPGDSQDLAVGRSVTKDAVRAAQCNYQSQLVAVTQRRVEQDAILGADDLFQIGTIAEVEASVGLDQLLRVRVTGKRTARLTNFRIEQGVPLVDAEVRDSQGSGGEEPKTLRGSIIDAFIKIGEPIFVEGEAALDSQGPLTQFIAQALVLSRRVLKERLGLDGTVSQPFPEDQPTRTRINAYFEQQQQILEETDSNRQLELLQALIAQGARK